MTNEQHTTEEAIIPSKEVIGVDNGIQVESKDTSQQPPSQTLAISSSTSTNSPSEPSTNGNSKSEQAGDTIQAVQKSDDDPDHHAGKDNPGVDDAIVEHIIDERPYSVFSHNEKKIIIFCAGMSQFFSPVSGQIYFPSLNAIAADLKVSSTLVNLTITTYLVSLRPIKPLKMALLIYQIMQGIAPAFVGGFSDSAGRRVAYFICYGV